MSHFVELALLWASGAAAGFLVCFYWLARPMARLLYFEPLAEVLQNPVSPPVEENA